MKNLTRQEQSEELATQGYQRRFFNCSPLVAALASAFDQALAHNEQGLTKEMLDSQGLGAERKSEEADDGIHEVLPVGTERSKTQD